MNRNVIVELALLILICIHKSYIVYLEIYVVPIGHGFSFLVMENQCWKRGGTLLRASSTKPLPVAHTAVCMC